MADDYPRPTYDPAEFQRLVESGPFGYRIESIAVNGAGALHFDETDIVACMLALNSVDFAVGGDFYKTMPSRTRPGTFHDVYRPTYERVAIYTKIQIMALARGRSAAIIQFKRDTSR